MNVNITKPSVSLISAMDLNGCIGKQGRLPWKISSDLKRFKMLTVGKSCIMGRKTFASLNYKPLVGRYNIVLTTKETLPLPIEESCVGIKHDCASALEEAAKQHPGKEVMVIGGGQVYSEFLNQATRIYLTVVETEVVGGDCWFPVSLWNGDEWNEVFTELTIQGSEQPRHKFKIYDRKFH